MIYHKNEKLTPLVTQISWTNNLLILSSSKSDIEREFYLNLSINERYSKRELTKLIPKKVLQQKLNELYEQFDGGKIEKY